jgi:hypothetical protein
MEWAAQKEVIEMASPNNFLRRLRSWADELDRFTGRLQETVTDALTPTSEKPGAARAAAEPRGEGPERPLDLRVTPEQLDRILGLNGRIEGDRSITREALEILGDILGGDVVELVERISKARDGQVVGLSVQRDTPGGEPVDTSQVRE